MNLGVKCLEMAPGKWSPHEQNSWWFGRSYPTDGTASLDVCFNVGLKDEVVRVYIILKTNTLSV